MFERRLAAGQHFHHPYLGCREFAADVRFDDKTTTAIDLDFTELMVYDPAQDSERNVFVADVRGGVYEVDEPGQRLGGGAERGSESRAAGDGQRQEQAECEGASLHGVSFSSFSAHSRSI
jgi:hypothetical protein